MNLIWISWEIVTRD